MSLRAPRRLATMIAVPTVIAAGAAFAAPAMAAHEADYEGSALTVSLKTTLGGQSLLDEILPSLVTFPEGGEDTLFELPDDLDDLVTLQVVNASSGLDDDNVLVSNAKVVGLGLLVDLVGASVLEATCTAKDEDVEGESKVAGLTLLGTKQDVELGPNFEIEIPESPLLKGKIVIDEQTEMEDGTLRVRALHVNLQIVPDLVGDALDSLVPEIRAMAEKLKVTIEAVTGKTLESLIGAEQAPADGAADAQEQDVTGLGLTGNDAKADKDAKGGAAATDRQRLGVSSSGAAAPAGAADGAAAAESAEAADASGGVVLEDEAAQDAAQAQAPAADAAAGSAKSDQAAIDRDAAAAAAADAAAEQGTAAEGTDEADLAARAEQAEKGTAAGQAAETQTGVDATATRSAATDQAVEAGAAEQAGAAQVRENQRAEATKSNKGDAADLGSADRAAAPAADDPEDDLGGALLGIDLVVSQVTCNGAPPPAEPKDPPKVQDLPETGGNGDMSRNVAASGLGLLMVGGTAVYVTRRRGRHAA